MENKTIVKKEKGKELLQKTEIFLFRWFYLIFFLAVAGYSAWLWNKYVLHPDWSEEKKQEYIKEQAVFSFDRDNYQKAVDVINARKDRLENGQKFSGRDIFYPEGF